MLQNQSQITRRFLNNEESTEFEKQSYFKSAILLRKFDEAAKRTDVK